MAAMPGARPVTRARRSIKRIAAVTEEASPGQSGQVPAAGSAKVEFGAANSAGNVDCGQDSPTRTARRSRCRYQLVYTEESLASTDKNKMLYITHHMEVKRIRYLPVQSGRGVETFSQGNNGCRRENFRLRRFFTRAPRASFTRLRCGTCRKVARTMKHPQGGSEPGQPPVGTGEGECGGVFY
ncbi:uncharacterized protein LOC120424825 [Culex pipiens pallens]|uniref:uncharacterized protein LOC120424825 n=1 Tax=Culex pipiens pallens TaxID=42434 RepID=UPI00195399A9|nr:uncharacterized protein LOC120424825 [Culex pipiens pallens]XP_039444979.1 uncharacterized protein LOC120424825 [Culex pipiens pallens]